MFIGFYVIQLAIMIVSDLVRYTGLIAWLLFLTALRLKEIDHENISLDCPDAEMAEHTPGG